MLTDPDSVADYIQLGIYRKVLDANGDTVDEVYTGQSAATPTQFINGLTSGELYTIQISFMTSEGLMIINETIVAP